MDLNEDGHADILSGSYSRMTQPMAGLFQVLWGQSDGSFRKAEVLKGADGEPLTIPSKTMTDNICTRPMAVDWDGDGKLDLVVGNFTGSFYLFTGKGNGAFLPNPELLTTSNGPLQIEGEHSDPFPVDWDGDGDLDLLSGSSGGGVQWAENRAAAGQVPQLEPFRTLIPAGPRAVRGEPHHEPQLAGPSATTRVWADDVNGDGKLDLLVGDSVTLVRLPEGLSERETREREAAWEQKIKTATHAYRAARNQEALREAADKLRALYEQRSEFVIEDYTGFVWLYVRK